MANFRTIASSALFAMRKATPPARNTLSHANKERDCVPAGKLFWKMPGHLQPQHAGFGRGGRNSLTPGCSAMATCKMST